MVRSLTGGLLCAIGLVLMALLMATPVQAQVPAPPAALEVGGFPEGEIRIAWTDTATNTTYFEIERSQDNRGGYALITTVPAPTTVYTDTALALDTTYWYRVRSCSDASCSPYSKDSYSVSFAAATQPNLDERYMLFLINESRADPAAYGYPNYTPLAPVMYQPLMGYAARSHSQAILNSDFTVGHCHPDPAYSQSDTEYRCPSERARDVGYYGGVAENLIAGGDGWEATQEAHAAFLASDGHRTGIFDINAKEAGIGHAHDPAKGSTWHGQYTQTFCGWNEVTLPELPAGVVVPYGGDETTEFSFLVNFYSAAGLAPTQAQVVIDGTPYSMTLRKGSASNGSYVYTTTLAEGTHAYHFAFQSSDGQCARLPEAGAYGGLSVALEGVESTPAGIDAAEIVFPASSDDEPCAEPTVFEQYLPVARQR